MLCLLPTYQGHTPPPTRSRYYLLCLTLTNFFNCSSFGCKCLFIKSFIILSSSVFISSTDAYGPLLMISFGFIYDYLSFFFLFIVIFVFLSIKLFVNVQFFVVQAFFRTIFFDTIALLFLNHQFGLKFNSIHLFISHFYSFIMVFHYFCYSYYFFSLFYATCKPKQLAINHHRRQLFPFSFHYSSRFFRQL